mgnify:CR=1 FL=1
MLIYHDILTGDELFSDAYPMRTIDDFFYEVTAQQVTRSDKIDERMIGGNASAEGGGDEAADDTIVQSGLNLVINGGHMENNFTKSDYKKELRDYCKKVLAKLQEKDPKQAEVFKSKAQDQMKKILEMWKVPGEDADNWQFFVSERYSAGGDGMVMLLQYINEEGKPERPVFWFWKDGLYTQKQ